MDFTENVSLGPLFACHDDQRLSSFSTKNTPVVLDTIRNGIVPPRGGSRIIEWWGCNTNTHEAHENFVAMPT